MDSDYSDADMMNVSDHAGDATMANQGMGGNSSHTRSLVMAWIFTVIVWWGLHFLFKGQLS